MTPSESASADPVGLRWSVRPIWIVVGAALLAGVAVLSVRISEVLDEPARFSRADFERQLAKARAGETKSIHFYTTTNTNAFLKQLEGMVEVEEVNFELADVSDAGMESVASLPRLRRLIIARRGPRSAL